MANETRFEATIWGLLAIVIFGIGMLVFANVTLSQQLASMQGDLAELKATSMGLESDLRELRTSHVKTPIAGAVAPAATPAKK